jgi:2-polyprenyl-3-methyl-5-hydroxy-6-metoxy-1,4-benzoquinol methylase
MAFSYDSIPAGYYDAVFHRRVGIQSEWHHDKFRRIIAEIGKTGRHLDFGCGPGTLIGLLDKEVRSLGLDMAAPQIEYARQRYGEPNKEFLKQSVPQTAFPAHSFDTVSCIEVIEHLPRELSLDVAREFKRLLREGGKLVITTPNYKSATCSSKVSPGGYVACLVRLSVQFGTMRFLPRLFGSANEKVIRSYNQGDIPY